MASTSIPQPRARTVSLVDLVERVWSGRVRIPDFQRQLRWQWEDVRRLFDSILKGYPIGNLLLWERPAPAVHIKLGALAIDAPQFSDGWWVVDGQQRLLSLANALKDEGARDNRFALAYNLRDSDFVRPPEIEDAFIVPLPVLFDLRRLLGWFAARPEALEKLEDASRVTKAMREFLIPAYVVEQQDEDVLRDIFDRMNNYGKRLSRAEVFSALHPGRRSNSDPGSRFDHIVETIDRDCGFGLVDADTVMRAVLARRGGDVTRDIRLEFDPSVRSARDFGDESTEAAYRQGEAAMARAVAFLQEDAGVPHFAFLPYRYLLVVLTRFFAHFPDPVPRNRGLLRRWLWRAALTGPEVFSGSWTHAMRTLANCIVAADEAGSLERLNGDPIGRALTSPRLTGFKTNKAESRVVACALWALNPRSLTTGEPYSRQKLIDVLSPEGTLASVLERVVRREPDGHRAMAANRLFALDDQPREGAVELLTAPPLTLRSNLHDAVFASHAMDRSLVDALSRHDVVRFLEGRQQRLAAIVASFVSRMAEADFEDTPPLDSLSMNDDDDDARDDDDVGAHGAAR